MLNFFAVSVPTLLSFALASFLIELTPGPNMTYLALVSASDGRKVGFATVAGITLGLAIIGLLAAFGVAELVQASRLAYDGLRWAGVLFLLYLAWDGWRQGEITVAAPKHEGLVRYFWRGLVTNILNPKAAVFYVAVLPTFLDATRSPLPQTILLSFVYVAVATIVHTLIVVLAGALEPMLNDPQREKIARRALSALLALVAIWFGWSTTR
ncbi:LysE family translocator [Mesorhizobium denitrificans]|uniref:LysE family translocator n=2 Tax=Phyllobacteriaceae TaxID=69277 RepID=A0A371XFJ8_9HYPH|nr:LysE family translocator [Mesorhizobium denitrificans]